MDSAPPKKELTSMAWAEDLSSLRNALPIGQCISLLGEGKDRIVPLPVSVSGRLKLIWKKSGNLTGRIFCREWER